AYAGLDAGEKAAVDAAVAQELKTNRYDPATKTLRLSAGEVQGLEAVRAATAQLFRNGRPAQALPADALTGASAGDLRDLGDFFFWTAWVSAAERPGTPASYTNNWPYDPAAGNTVAWPALWWSAASVALLILAFGGIFYWYFAKNLGMQMRAPEEAAALDPGSLPVTPSQRKTAKYFAVVAVLFLLQTLMGAYMAHSYVEGTRFYGLEIGSWFPYNVARTWHLQLAVLWIATAWLGMGLYIAPLVSGKEPRRQGLLVDLLFGALVVVTLGSLLGEWLGVRNVFGRLWFWLGNQGWNYLELGRLWQILLFAGMLIWLAIVYRALKPALRAESDRGGLTHLLFYTAVTIPAFYVFGFLVNPGVSVTFSDYWRWWVIHLWVEGMFETFAVAVIGFLMVHLGLATRRSTVRALYFQFAILLGSGIVGTGHHYYWIGAPEMWIGLGAVFSALEVIPLTLLIGEAWEQVRVLRRGGRGFAYADAFRFLVATGVWNLVGAGVLGFLINLPVVAYFEHGSWLTLAHAHGALMGVYGMFAIALALFALRNVVEPAAWARHERLLRLSFWGLNAGLVGMIVMTLLPVGFLQLAEAFRSGFFAARSLAFYQEPLVHALLWLRIVPDTVFIALGVVPFLIFAVRALFHLRAVTRGAQGAEGEAAVGDAGAAGGAAAGR
ncbi:MAG: cbb3-type cytochrome c oxidase subunit I, partial [Bacillota bacterium]|nr:cbb3-type cytochrome c oxidase subunit I [Bacillota bacterium]